jgi:hypothetical protein
MARACRAAGATRSPAEDCGSIDGHWFATPLDHGWFGLLVEARFLRLPMTMAATHVRSPRSVVALLFIVCCVVASITETGLGDAPPYLLELVVAASLLAPKASRRVR